MDEADEGTHERVAERAPRRRDGAEAGGQAALFDDGSPHGGTDARAPCAADVAPAVAALARRLAVRFGDRLALGTSSWHFPGWAGLVWDRPVPAAVLSRAGLAVYARHPLLRTVSLDRAFYRPLPAPDYAALAAQVPAGFRFVVKAPALVTDACLRDARGRETGANPRFLDPRSAVDACAAPAAEGLGAALGVLVFQLSRLPGAWRDRPEALLPRLEAMLAAGHRVFVTINNKAEGCAPRSVMALAEAIERAAAAT